MYAVTTAAVRYLASSFPQIRSVLQEKLQPSGNRHDLEVTFLGGIVLGAMNNYRPVPHNKLQNLGQSATRCVQLQCILLQPKL